MPRVNGHPRNEKSTYRPSAVAVLLILCALALILVFTSGAASWISDNILLPVGSFLGIAKRQDPRDSLLAQEGGATPSPDANERQILLPEQLQYYLQMGYYSDRTSADIQAKFIQSIGGAGYVYYDGSKYRVFAACYRDQTSAEKVQEQIRADGYDSATYIIQTDAVKIRYSYPESMDGDGLNLSNLACELGNEAMDIILEIDKQNLDAIGANAQLADLILKIDTQLAAIAEYMEFDAIYEYLGSCKALLSTFCETSGTLSKVEYSTNLKHVQISISIMYHQFVTEL